MALGENLYQTNLFMIIIIVILIIAIIVVVVNIIIMTKWPILQYSNFRNYAPPLDVKGGIIAEKVVPVFSESSFLACFGMVV